MSEIDRPDDKEYVMRLICAVDYSKEHPYTKEQLATELKHMRIDYGCDDPSMPYCMRVVDDLINSGRIRLRDFRIAEIMSVSDIYNTRAWNNPAIDIRPIENLSVGDKRGVIITLRDMCYPGTE